MEIKYLGAYYFNYELNILLVHLILKFMNFIIFINACSSLGLVFIFYDTNKT